MDGVSTGKSPKDSAIMPKQYLAIKKKLESEGLSKKEAEKHAAMIYNSKGKGHVGKGSK